MALTYLGTCAGWIQISPPTWDKNYAGQPDSCSIVYQGPQVLEKAFLDALTEFQTMVTVAGLSVVDERGNAKGDSHMWLLRATSDESAIMPKVTCYFMGCRGGVIPEPLPEDDITIQSATTTHTISDGTSPNDGKAITLAIQFRSARTTYEWCQLTDPAGTPTHATIRNPITLTQPPSDDIVSYKYSGMVDSAGDPTTSISTGDATAVWNTFGSYNQTSSFSSKETVPGKLWQCQSVNDAVLQGT